MTDDPPREFRARLRLKPSLFENLTVTEAFQAGSAIRLRFEEIPWIGQVNRADALTRMRKNLGWKTPGDLFPKGERVDAKIYPVPHPHNHEVTLIACDVIPRKTVDDYR